MSYRKKILKKLKQHNIHTYDLCSRVRAARDSDLHFLNYLPEEKQKRIYEDDNLYYNAYSLALFEHKCEDNDYFKFEPYLLEAEEPTLVLTRDRILTYSEKEYFTLRYSNNVVYCTSPYTMVANSLDSKTMYMCMIATCIVIPQFRILMRNNTQLLDEFMERCYAQYTGIHGKAKFEDLYRMVKDTIKGDIGCADAYRVPYTSSEDYARVYVSWDYVQVTRLYDGVPISYYIKYPHNNVDRSFDSCVPYAVFLLNMCSFIVKKTTCSPVDITLVHRMPAVPVGVVKELKGVDALYPD